MAYVVAKAQGAKINILGSEIGLITKTVQVASEGVQANADGEKIVPMGTVYPANDATAKGIIFEDVNVTEGDRVASLIVAGRVLQNRLPATVADAAKPVLAALGIVLVDEPETNAEEIEQQDLEDEDPEGSDDPQVQ